jgi:hypothetical protein
MEKLNIALIHSGQYPSSYPSTAKWKEILEARSYVASVTKEHIVTVTQEELNSYDLVVNTDECINYPQQSKLRGLTVPVLNMNDRIYDLLKIATGGGSVYEIADLIIKDNTHEITEEYSEDETITGYSSPYYIMRFYNVAEDFQVLGKVSYFGLKDSLIVLEVGGKFLDDFENTSRFASFPFYRPNDTYELTQAALTLLDRVIEWLLGSATYTLTVQSSGVESVGISVSPDDENSEGDGITPFSREYEPDTEVTLIAPENKGDLYFQKWTYDGEDSFDRTKTLTIPSEDKPITATYVPLDYTVVIKFNVLKRDRAFSVERRKKSFSVPKRAKNFKVEKK